MTKRFWATLLSLATFGFVLVMASCADQNPVGSMLNIEQPDAIHYTRSFDADYAKIIAGEVPDFTERYNSAIIDQNGGSLYVSGNMLLVPRGAVSGPTKFEIQLAPDGSIGAELTATAVGSDVRNDVGHAGFRRPLTLIFTYAYANNVPDQPELMRVAWRKDDGTLEVQPSYVDTHHKMVYGQIYHFTPYIVIAPS
ncbi:MAG TPA: hypothetical protein VFL93_14920 [Longimicrobiaceae bacterium]|nr:hypothetical protein [Longimicrobiaceae bacterium]